MADPKSPESPGPNAPSPGGLPDDYLQQSYLQQSVQRLRRRETFTRWAQLSVRALFYGAIVALVGLFIVSDSWRWGWIGGVLGTSLLTALAITWAQRPTAVQLAKSYDDHLGLKDRLSSALDLPGHSPMVSLLRNEALSTAATVDPKRVFRFKVPREGWWLPLPIVLVATFIFWPDSAISTPHNVALEETILAQADRLEQLRDQLSQEKNRENDKTIELLDELLSDLDREKIQKKETLSKLSEVMKKLEDEYQEKQKKLLDEKELLKKLLQNEQTKDLAEQVENGDYDEAARKLKQLEKELEKKLKDPKKPLSPEEREKLEREIKKMKELQAKLIRMRNLKLNIQQSAQVLDFLADFEGEIGEIDDMDLSDLKFVKLDPPPPGGT